MLSHPIWSQDEVLNVKVTHVDPQYISSRFAYWSVQFIRKSFDWFTGYSHDAKMTEQKWLQRIIFLETIAGVPGMMGAMARHLKSLRSLKRDNGWIHTLLEEAENERMHLFTILKIRQPGFILKFMIIIAQGIFVNMFFLAYLLSPRYCHSFVGYLEEEAVKTYTHCLKDIEDGVLPWKNTPAPDIARKYWNLNENATMKEVILAIRADESLHREVNHTLSKMKPYDKNPY